MQRQGRLCYAMLCLIGVFEITIINISITNIPIIIVYLPLCFFTFITILLFFFSYYCFFFFDISYQTTGEDYAVKVIDLRPLRLREKFNPTRYIFSIFFQSIFFLDNIFKKYIIIFYFLIIK